MKTIQLRLIFKYVLYVTLFFVLHCSCFVKAVAEPIDGTGLSWEIIPLTEPQDDSEGTAKLEISITGEGSRNLPDYAQLNSGTLAPWLTSSDNQYGLIIIGDSNTNKGKIKVNDNDVIKVYKITKLILPDGLTKIGDNCFPYLCYLNDLIIPGTVTQIGEFSFHNCNKLNNITFLNSSLPEVKANAFLNIASNGTLYVVNPDEVTDKFILDYFPHDDKTGIKWSKDNLTNLSFSNQNNLLNLSDPIIVQYNESGTYIDVPVNDWEKPLPVYARANRYTGSEKFDNPEYVKLSDTGNKVSVNKPGKYLIEKLYKISGQNYTINASADGAKLSELS